MFGELVRSHRRRLGISQAELAERTGIGVRSIGKIETGRVAGPRPVTVRLLADAFELVGTERDRFCQAAGEGASTPTIDRGVAREHAMADRLESGGTPKPVNLEPSPVGFGAAPAERLATRTRRWWVAGLTAAVVVTIGGVALWRSRQDTAPARLGERSATVNMAAQCLPVTGDWNEKNDPRDRASAPGSVTAAVACKAGPGLQWMRTDRPGGGPVRMLDGVGNAEFCLPVTGDWNGDGITTTGVACSVQAELRWKLINSLDGGNASLPDFLFGEPDDCWPVTGDWDGDGRTGVGVACREGSTILWRLSDKPAVALSRMFLFGNSYDCWPVTGDWDGDGRTGVGTACRDGSDTRWSLTDTLADTPPTVASFAFGPFGSCRPVTGDWNSDRRTGVGVACYTDAEIRWHLANTGDGSPSYAPFLFGDAEVFRPDSSWRGPDWPRRAID